MASNCGNGLRLAASLENGATLPFSASRLRAKTSLDILSACFKSSSARLASAAE